MSSVYSPVGKYTTPGSDPDTFIEPILVLSGERIKIEQAQIPKFFSPVTGKWRMTDLHKTFVDDESYNSGHGHAYQFYGVDPTVGAIAIIRPDQCKNPNLNVVHNTDRSRCIFSHRYR